MIKGYRLGKKVALIFPFMPKIIQFDDATSSHCFDTKETIKK